MPRSFAATAYDSPSILASTGDSFNQLTEALESNLNEFIFKAKCHQPLVNFFHDKKLQQTIPLFIFQFSYKNITVTFFFNNISLSHC
jgi:hypothetical protein